MSTIVMQLPSERIIQDIDKWAKAIEMIIGEDGCIVPDLDLRNGHRKASAALHAAATCSRMRRPPWRNRC